MAWYCRVLESYEWPTLQRDQSLLHHCCSLSIKCDDHLDRSRVATITFWTCWFQKAKSLPRCVFAKRRGGAIGG